MNAKIMHPIFENFTSIQITKSYSPSVKLSPGERFITIGNILRHLNGRECHTQKNGVLVKKISSEIMGIFSWTQLIWEMYKRTTNNRFLTSTCSLAYTKMDIGNVEIPHEKILDTLTIKIWSILKLKLKGTMKVCDICLEF
eukprot:245604_1